MAGASLVVLTGAMALAQESAQATRTDGQIEMDVVHALDATPELKNELITAATIQSEVTLSGTVASESSSKLAESIVTHVSGVTKVNNELLVGNVQASEQKANSCCGLYPADVPNDSGQLSDQIRDEVHAQIQAQRQAQQRLPAYKAATGPVTVSAGTMLRLRTNQPIRSKKAKEGQPVDFTLIQDVAVGGVLAIPRGATLHGVVTEAKQAGDLKGRPELALRLTSLDLGGQNYLLDSDQFKVKGPGKGANSANNMIGGTLMGTIIGCAVGRGVGCAVGAGAGLAAGTAASAATPGPGIWIPAEARVDIHLSAPLTVTPVSPQEAARLAQGLFPGGPNLYQRGYYANGRPMYVYPPVYYRPYYPVGGYYYWR
jgi:hypothetical protein